MNDRQSLGKFIAILCYLSEGLVVIFASGLRHTTMRTHVATLILLIVSFTVLVTISKKKIQLWKFNIMNIILSSIMGMGLCFTFRNGYIMFFLFFVQWMQIILFMDIIACYFMFVFQILMMTFFTFYHYDFEMVTFGLAEYVIAIFALLTGMAISKNIIKIMEFDLRQSREQERSLDDLLKVVEAKVDEARMATKSKSLFLSSMSHEIRTPINSVLGMNEMILRESNEKKIVEYAMNVESSGNMLLSLINDILDFSKIESGKMDIIQVEYQLSSVLNDLVNMIKPRADKKGLEFIVDTEADIPEYLYGDEMKLRQIITNLLTNAVKYTEEGSVTLALKYNKVNDKEINLQIFVKDTGKGIRSEDRDKLFDSFQRVDEKQNRNIEGTGLGLAISSRFVELLSGKIGVDSVYGEGSVFYVTLPQGIMKDTPMGNFKEKLEESYENRQEYEESFIAPNAKILVVDDNRMNLTVVQLLLKKTQIQVDMAKSGQEALEVLYYEDYDLILLDHMMPDMDGVETLQKIKERHMAEGTPIIALTANAVSGAKEMYTSYGFEDYLSKPVVGKVLEKMLVKWLPPEKVEKK